MGEEIEPQFKLWMGIWHCYVPGGEFVYAGLGYDKAGALEDWKRMQEKYRSSGNSADGYRPWDQSNGEAA